MFSAEDREKIRAAVVAAEERTRGEIVPMVVPASGRYEAAPLLGALVALLTLSGILMRNTLILIGQIRTNEEAQLAPFDAVVEATVQRARPVVLTALAAMLAFIPLTHSVFWGTLAYTLIGGTFGGTVLTLVFLPALYAIWFKIKPAQDEPAVAAIPGNNRFSTYNAEH